MTEKIIGGRKVILIQEPEAADLLIQPVDDHDLSWLEQQQSDIRSRIPGRPVTTAAFLIHDWNKELSPWPAPPVFGKEPFGDGAEKTLDYVLNQLMPGLMADSYQRVFLGGYSLAGFFALWAAYQSDAFAGAAGVSPSVWFPGWEEYIAVRRPLTDKIYLSLGTKEEKTRNQVMARVGDSIRSMYSLLQAQGISSTLEWNPGNHFQDSGLRVAKGFAWLLKD